MQGVWVGFFDKWVFIPTKEPGSFNFYKDKGLLWIAVDYFGEQHIMRVEGVLHVEQGSAFVRP